MIFSIFKEEMMKPLYEFCEGWENCKNKDLQDLFEKKIIEREKFERPTGKKLEELKEICANCKHRLKIEEAKCPVCGGTILTTPAFLSEIEQPSITEYLYICIDCKRHLYSYRKL